MCALMFTTKAERTLQSCVVLSAETQHIQALDINSATLSLVSGRRCYQMSSQGVNGVPRQEVAATVKIWSLDLSACVTVSHPSTGPSFDFH